jgi:hypothetical protein
MLTITRNQAWELIEKTNGQIFTARVIKRTDGSNRTLNCRLARTTKVGKVGGSLKYNASEKNLVAVFEVAAKREDSDKYRMLNVDGLMELAIAGERYRVE